MKAFKYTAIEWLIFQTDNDLDDRIFAKFKDGVKLGVVYECFTGGQWGLEHLLNVNTFMEFSL